MPDTTSDEFAHDGTCPRCESEDIEREVIRHTTEEIVAGVVFFCTTCGLTGRTVSADREAWFFLHQQWGSPALEADTLDAFLKVWPKKVGRPAYGDPEPIGPILPRVD